MAGALETICLTNLGTIPFTTQQEWVVGTVEKVGLVQPAFPHPSATQSRPSWKVPKCPDHLSKVEQQQLRQVLFTQHDGGLGCTQVGGPVHITYQCQNPHVRQED